MHKHRIRLSVDYRQDLSILIRLFKSLVGDSPTEYLHVHSGTSGQQHENSLAEGTDYDPGSDSNLN